MKTIQVLFCSYLFVITILSQSVKAQCRNEATCNERCPSGRVHLAGETETYKVVICAGTGNRGPSHYLGENKNNGSSILLPLTSYDSDLGKYVARNGKFTYTLMDYKLIIKARGKKTINEALDWTSK
jgi:hypothetical protein